MPEPTTFNLSSGKVATMRPGKGRDLLNAQRVAREPAEVNFALLAELTEIDGKHLVMEDYLEMDLGDVLKLSEEVQKQGNAPCPAASTSSSSPT